MKKSLSLKITTRIHILLIFTIFTTECSCDKSSNSNSPEGNPEGSNIEVNIQGSVFSPSSITVDVNTNIKLKKKDGSAHMVTSDAGLFDSGTIWINGVFSQTFTSAGTYACHCTLHYGINASVKLN